MRQCTTDAFDQVIQTILPRYQHHFSRGIVLKLNSTLQMKSLKKASLIYGAVQQVLSSMFSYLGGAI